MQIVEIGLSRKEGTMPTYSYYCKTHKATFTLFGFGGKPTNVKKCSFVKKAEKDGRPVSEDCAIEDKGEQTQISP